MRSKLSLVVKSSIFIALATISFNVFAEKVYLGNPTRPDTVVVPAHCDRHGCWHEVSYMKVLGCADCAHATWAGDHWELHHYVVVGGY
ncbi:MAG TPA: hypothetical protein VNC84_03395 [Gammaproteobacteria bacterium]|jgi:hypothetical protein|nr:hypothetical protein [Gammaproteobacteria bacterium]